MSDTDLAAEVAELRAPEDWAAVAASLTETAKKLSATAPRYASGTLNEEVETASIRKHPWPAWCSAGMARHRCDIAGMRSRGAWAILAGLTWHRCSAGDRRYRWGVVL